MIIKEGKGEGKIQVGVSTFDNVVNDYGTEYNLIQHDHYSYEIAYPRLGISFVYSYYDVKKRIFWITIKEPFECSTSKGIILGKSLMIDVIKAYGEPKWETTYESETWWTTYPGINFHVRIDKSIPRFPLNEKRYINELITEIDIIEM